LGKVEVDGFVGESRGPFLMEDFASRSASMLLAIFVDDDRED
jgi:hypothetical protein